MFFIRILEGILIGFLMSAPIGAIGILCIRRTLSSGRRQGYITGLAGASGDFVFATVSAFGIKLVADFITYHQHEIRLVGGILLILMGILLFRSHRAPVINKERPFDGTGIYFSTLILALTNPLVMFGYGAVMSALGVARVFHGFLSLSLLVTGIFVGSLLWFFVLANLVHRYREMVSGDKLAIVNRIAGALLVLIGLSAIWGGMKGLRF
jgi:threonine/homoserine/homoserine lactone efflux protein